MPKTLSKFTCQNCGYVSPRWTGKCSNCNEWNTFVEEITSSSQKKSSHHLKETANIVSLDKVDVEETERIKTNIEEFDRVLGGGIVPGSVILVGGDPGIGKSTLMMQFAGALKEETVLYITGEESLKQVRLRSERLGMSSMKNIFLLAETNMEIISALLNEHLPRVVVVDSIQTMYYSQMESPAGSVGQVRESTAAFTKFAKNNNIPVFLVGHVTKEGLIAGPKVIEHIVDTVLQFEGDNHYSYRILRAMKNRFGSTNEIGIFEMRDVGLREVKNPSEVFLSERKFGNAGSAVVATIEGTRPILVEVQALVTSTSYNIPQRNATGFDLRRLAMLLAVLEKRVGLKLGTYDVFVNVAGGIRIDEPASDLGIASSIVSSLRDKAIDAQSVAIGEVGLGGEIRTVSQIERRVQEAAKLGFKKIIVPKNNLKELRLSGEVEVIGVEGVETAIKELIN
ncbi:MAG: DNA repair protein RadA [Ignavibacteriales bacterium]|nr:DNA repair protein RadA [Ignavibacteriales bacterium]